MTVLVDRYELQEHLGSGGMARVHAALDQRLGRRVAVKLVREDLVGDGQSRARLLREARSAAAFHHPNAVAVFDVGEHGGQPFIVMELVEGGSLADRLQREGRLEPGPTVRIATQVLDALAAAHERSLVHRDIKPANILLPRGGGVKLADFGIAKALGEQAAGLTAAGEVMGSPTYLSPEQASGEQASPASDLYSLGVVLYECLTGRPPFTGDSAIAVAMAHQRQPVPSLRRAVRDLSPALAQTVERALAKDPADRYPNAQGMGQALQEALGGTAPPSQPTRRTAAVVTTRALPRDDITDDDLEPTAAVGEPIRATSREEAPRARRRWPRRLVVLAAVLLVALGLAAFVLGGEDTTDLPEAPDPVDDAVEPDPAPPPEEPAEPPEEQPQEDEAPAEEDEDPAPPEEPQEPEEPEEPPAEDDIQEP